MCSNSPFLVQAHPDISPRHGFSESHSENLLRDAVLMAAAFTGAAVALVLYDESGVWYRDGAGLTGEQIADLERAFGQPDHHEPGPSPIQPQDGQVIESLPLMNDCNQSIGTLCLMSLSPFALSEAQRGGLVLLAGHIETIVAMDHQRIESRSMPRPPSAASFVPGLVHELGSFIFGISASLDAFEARFAGLEEVGKYGENIRRSLDRMSAFNVELKDYGYPQPLCWARLELAPLLLGVIEEVRPHATKNNVELRLQIEGVLPAIHADEQGLRKTFTRLLDLILQQEDSGETVTLKAAAIQNGSRTVIAGQVDFSSAKFKQVDLTRLFEPFYFRVSGLGRLTLPGARRVFESHGGTLTAGTGPGGGMRISFILPSDTPNLTHPLKHS